jgi:hypothetical protein
MGEWVGIFSWLSNVEERPLPIRREASVDIIVVVIGLLAVSAGCIDANLKSKSQQCCSLFNTLM